MEVGGKFAFVELERMNLWWIEEGSCVDHLDKECDRSLEDDTTDLSSPNRWHGGILSKYGCLLVQIIN